MKRDPRLIRSAFLVSLCGAVTTLGCSSGGGGTPTGTPPGAVDAGGAAPGSGGAGGAAAPSSGSGGGSGGSAGAGGSGGGTAGADGGDPPGGDAGAPTDGQPVMGKQIAVTAGTVARERTIVSFALPGSEGKNLVLRDAQGVDLPLQVAANGTATFILPALAAGQQARFTVAAAATPAATGVELVEEANGVKFVIGTSNVMRFQTQGLLPPGAGAGYLRGGYLYPLYTPGGGVPTDDYPPSHPHQHGLWTAWVSTQFAGHGVNFWDMTGGGRGKVDFDALETTWKGPVHAGLEARLVHQDLTGAQPVTAMREKWVVTAYKTHESAPPYFVFDLHSTQEAASNLPVVLNQAVYGGFGMRGHRQWLNGANVTFLTSEGRDRAGGDNTKTRWCYMGGTVDGQIIGYAALGHPDNLRAPQRVRLNPVEPYWAFAPVKEGNITVAPGMPLVSRYRVVTFDGPANSALLDRLWSDYATPPTVVVE